MPPAVSFGWATAAGMLGGVGVIALQGGNLVDFR